MGQLERAGRGRGGLVLLQSLLQPGGQAERRDLLAARHGSRDAVSKTHVFVLCTCTRSKTHTRAHNTTRESDVAEALRELLRELCGCLNSMGDGPNGDKKKKALLETVTQDTAFACAVTLWSQSLLYRMKGDIQKEAYDASVGQLVVAMNARVRFKTMMTTTKQAIEILRDAPDASSTCSERFVVPCPSPSMTLPPDFSKLHFDEILDQVEYALLSLFETPHILWSSLSFFKIMFLTPSPIYSQMKAGQYTLKRIVTLLGKQAEAQRAYGLSMEKITIHETTKDHSGDRMLYHLQASMRVLDVGNMVLSRTHILSLDIVPRDCP
jgi:hypothetical protein